MLQTIDLVRPATIWTRLVAAQAVRRGCRPAKKTMIAGLVRSALSVRLLCSARRPASTGGRCTSGPSADDGTVLEGYIDLVYRDDDGTLAIVDYKTDAVPSAALPSRITYYKPQMDAYREALDAATGSSSTATLVFLHPTRAAVTSVGV